MKHYEIGDIGALEERKPAWSKLPDNEQDAVLDLALEKPGLSTREIAVTCTNEKERFVSASKVYRLLKAMI